MRAQKTETKLRQEHIVQAALDLISVEGLLSLSIAGIAERVGIVPSALYRHFKSKDDVLDGVLELIKKRLLSNVDHAKKQTPDALEQLKILLFLQIRMLSENRAIPHVVFSDGIYTGNPERKIKVFEIMATFLGKIQNIIEVGKQDGSICEDVVASTVSVMFMGMILPAAILWNLSDGGFDMNAHVENAWAVFVRCISAEN